MKDGCLGRTSSGATLPSITRPKRSMMRQVVFPKPSSSLEAASRFICAILSAGFLHSTCDTRQNGRRRLYINVVIPISSEIAGAVLCQMDGTVNDK